MERLAVADPTPRAPAARSEAQPAPEQQNQPQQPPPVSSKGIVHPARPGYGKLGKKVMVRANHFVVQVPDKDTICHYDVSLRSLSELAAPCFFD